MELSIGKVVEKIDSVAPDGLLDKSASPKPLHIDAANEYATESLQKCVDSRKAHTVSSLTMWKTLKDGEDDQ